MKVITITREYGAGGGDVAKRLAHHLGWKLLDHELLHQAAGIEKVPDADLEGLDEKAIRMADRLHLNPLHQKYLHGMTQVVREEALRGNVVLLGRAARHLLGDMSDAFHLRLVAPLPWRAERMTRLEGGTLQDAQARCKRIDRARSRFIRYFFGESALQPAEYDLVVNTGRVAFEDLADWVAAVVRQNAAGENGVSLSATAPEGSEKQTPFFRAHESRRVLTLSRELGAGDTGFAPSLAARLHLRVYDRELLEEEANRLGITEPEIEKLDEQPAGLFERLRSGSAHQQYVEALEQTMLELAEQGDAILVGRGGNCFLQRDPRAFHVRLVAPTAVRLRRIMEFRWVRESMARKLMVESDSQRRRFYESCFGVDWADPLEYHLTVNSGRLMWNALDLIAIAAERQWSHKTPVEDQQDATGNLIN